MPIATNLGYPRIGRQRDLKRALEGYWSSSLDSEALLAEASRLRRERWEIQRRAGLEHIPSNDFSLYDHVLDMALTVGAVPKRFSGLGLARPLDLMFAMARGAVGEREVVPLDMTKWFDTNYHYLVPELEADQGFELGPTKPVDEFVEAKRLGMLTRPVLLGPVTFLRLSRVNGLASVPLELLDGLLPVYAELLRQLEAAGAEWVQIDEPCLAQEVSVEVLEALERSYQELRTAAPSLKLLLASYFGRLGGNLAAVLELPVDAVHLDLIRGREDLSRALELVPEAMALSLGVVDGRNVWRTDPGPALGLIREAVTKLGEARVMVAPSCSLLHVPVSLEAESALDPELRSWLAFAEEKLLELADLAHAPVGAVELGQRLDASRAACAGRAGSGRVTDQRVRQRLAQVTPEQLNRPGDGPSRRLIWRQSVAPPILPTTTVGSFPQARELRQARARLRRGELTQVDYDGMVEEEIRRTIHFQEDVGLDVLVHGESERNDMVEYFAERLDGFLTTQAGWVQSYGSRCAKPPILYGDVSRPADMTVRWATFAQSLTQSPVKGMLTGPVTILQWSFVRDDLPRREVCTQIALAVRDEVRALEDAGIRVIQIDEPALREGLPLQRSQQPEYLRWAVDSFRLAAAGAGAGTQIHTHMCYSEFGEIMDAISELDADVLYIETARSAMSLLQAFADEGYVNEVGPGVYDIHSPLVPSVEEMVQRLRQAVRVIPAERLWVNPDCGLKTRAWPETEAAIVNMVAAAKAMRAASAA